MEMNSNNFYYYPYNPFYDLQHYHSMIPYFQSLLDYNSSSEMCHLPQLQPVKIITAAVDSIQTLQKLTKQAKNDEFKFSKNKKGTSNRKILKENKQRSTENNNKKLKLNLIQQKQGRNANSNLLRMFFRRLQNKIQDNSHQIQNIITKFQMKITLQEFIQWIQINKIDYRNYIKVSTIKRFFVNQQFVREHTKIMRILFRDFIDNEAMSCYLTSKKVRRQIMVHNYHTIRNIFKEILSVKD